MLPVTTAPSQCHATLTPMQLHVVGSSSRRKSIYHSDNKQETLSRLICQPRKLHRDVYHGILHRDFNSVYSTRKTPPRLICQPRKITQRFRFRLLADAISSARVHSHGTYHEVLFRFLLTPLPRFSTCVSSMIYLHTLRL